MLLTLLAVLKFEYNTLKLIRDTHWSLLIIECHIFRTAFKDSVNLEYGPFASYRLRGDKIILRVLLVVVQLLSELISSRGESGSLQFKFFRIRLYCRFLKNFFQMVLSAHSLSEGSNFAFPFLPFGISRTWL